MDLKDVVNNDSPDIQNIFMLIAIQLGQKDILMKEGINARATNSALLTVAHCAVSDLWDRLTVPYNIHQIG